MATKVLLIDDQKLVAAAVRRLCAEDGGFEIAHCQDPRQAVAMADEHEPSVMLVDMVMPGVSGIDVVRELRAHEATAGVPIIVLSAEDDAETKARAFAAGANDYLIKLPQAAELLARLRYHTRAWATARERDAAYRALAVSHQRIELQSTFIRDTFGRYLSDEVVERLLETPGGLQLGGERRRVSVLIADLRGFTGVAERLPPEQVVAILNHHFEVMTDVIVAYGGTIEELMGDGLLVVFGAPVEQDDHAERAVTCAVVMQLAMQRVHERCRAEGMPEVQMGIGVHTGEVVAGNVGSRKRAKYGVVGAAVNLAARIEAFTVGGQILVSDAARAEVPGEITVVDSFTVEPKGVAQPITIHDVVGIGGENGLEIPRFESDMVYLERPVEVRVAVLEGKTHRGAAQVAELTRVGACDAELVVAGGAPRPFADLVIELVGGPPGRFYGKVLSRGSGGPGVLVRFTGVPEEMVGALQKMAAGKR